MPDCSWVNPRQATGAALSSPDEVEALVRQGVTDVIDCRAEFDDAPLFAAHPEVRYMWNPTDDDGQPKPPRWFSKSIVFALDALSHRHRKVYTHCAAGVNRGPSTTYAILVAQGWPPSVAEEMIRKARPQVGLAYKLDADSAVARLGYV